MLKTFRPQVLNAQHISYPIIGHTFCKRLEKDHQSHLDQVIF